MRRDGPTDALSLMESLAARSRTLRWGSSCTTLLLASPILASAPASRSCCCSPTCPSTPSSSSGSSQRARWLPPPTPPTALESWRTRCGFRGTDGHHFPELLDKVHHVKTGKSIVFVVFDSSSCSTASSTASSSRANPSESTSVPPGTIGINRLFRANGAQIRARRRPQQQPHSPTEPAAAEAAALQLDTCALPYSSGTTGVSKGVMLSHRNLIANIQQLLAGSNPRLDLSPEDTVLGLLPMFHIYRHHPRQPALAPRRRLCCHPPQVRPAAVPAHSAGVPGVGGAHRAADYTCYGEAACGGRV
ncbi:hypothetical protein CLOP_g17020 [Closterium sp. NIES-67]|nr:hypothetical protein CLOP_g17020 [Closterium sp. NIES-67]